MIENVTPIVNWSVFARMQAMLGLDFIRVLGYFNEDGIKSVAAIEHAMRVGDASKIVMPAHTLKSEAAQFGAERLSQLAEHIEMMARNCVELRQQPDELLQQVVSLRPLFQKSVAALDKEVTPRARRGAFGRRAVSAKTAGFGRLAPTRP